MRNVCILAHVDHGKTTLADALVASNGLISQRLAGQLRYLDSRKDEQERGITMKSSAVTLAWKGGHIINLIDSPGHVDFSSEVSTAVRLCDGAIVLVDVVEGVQPQTEVVLRQAWSEGIRPVLVLNKMDRLITEMKLSPLDAYVKLSQVLEAINAVIGQLFASEVMLNQEVDKVTSGLEDADDSDLYFSPDRGNVVFASASDSWAFSLKDFADIYADKLGFNKEVLEKTLWGDYYVNVKAKKICKGALLKAKKPLFVQLILENIWALYEAILNSDTCRVEKMVQTLGIKVANRDLKSGDKKQQLCAIFGQWLPITNSLLDMVIKNVPSPDKLSSERVEKLMCSRTSRFDLLHEETRRLKEVFMRCDCKEEKVIVYVSKMFPVAKKHLPRYRPKPLTKQELEQRREVARRRHFVKTRDTVQPGEPILLPEKKQEPEEDLEGTTFLAFARVFSGTLRPGQELYILGPKHDPLKALEKLSSGQEVVDNVHVKKASISHLYLLLGRELEELQEVPAGNIVGIGGLDQSILKSATLSTELSCPPFVEITTSSVPILRVAVEPKLSKDLPALLNGLHLLNQADANVQVVLNDKGEHILVTSGEVHLERCLRDLEETYAKVGVAASAPIVPFRETIIEPPEKDMVNEQVVVEDTKNDTFEIKVETAGKQISGLIKAVPLPLEATELLESKAALLKAIQGLTPEDLANPALSSESKELVQELVEKLEDIFKNSDLEGCALKIWAFGPKRCGSNVLISLVDGLEKNASIVNGFQLATLAGPLCEEPLAGVAFLLLEWKEGLENGKKEDLGPLAGQIVSCIKEGCRKAFQARHQRLMAAMYTCDIAVKAEVLGKMFALLNKRHGKVVSENMVEGSDIFTVTAHLPVVESFNFANEIRKQTSGLAMPQLVFSHWETIDVDPFWEPQTDEELLHFGDKADSENQARTYMNDVRKKKGLAIDEKIVEFAEKQRTLTKMK